MGRVCYGPRCPVTFVNNSSNQFYARKIHRIKCIGGIIRISIHTLCSSVLLPQAVALYSVEIRGSFTIESDAMTSQPIATCVRHFRR